MNKSNWLWRTRQSIHCTFVGGGPMQGKTFTLYEGDSFSYKDQEGKLHMYRLVIPDGKTRETARKATLQYDGVL